MRYSKISSWLSPIAIALAIILLLGNIFLWLIPFLSNDPGFSNTLSLNKMLTGLLFSTLHMMILAYGLLVIARIFRQFAKEQWINLSISAGLKHFGVALFVYAVLSPANFYLMHKLVFSNHTTSDDEVFMLPISLNDFVLGVIGLLVILLSYAMKEATYLANENRQIV